MNVLINILIQSNMENNMKSTKSLNARSTIYGAVSVIFSGPESKKFSMLMEDDFRKSVVEACLDLEEDVNHKGNRLISKLFQKLINKVDNVGLERVKSEFVNIFGHTLSKQITPYALEHLKNSDVFFRTQKLADLNGFYKAFGMEVESIERADHISTQAEFMSALLFKEIMADQNNLFEEKEICQKALADFQKEHFLDWVEIFSENMINYVEDEFYMLAGKFLYDFIKVEKNIYKSIKIPIENVN